MSMVLLVLPLNKRKHGDKRKNVFFRGNCYFSVEPLYFNLISDILNSLLQNSVHFPWVCLFNHLLPVLSELRHFELFFASLEMFNLSFSYPFFLKHESVY